MSSTTFPTNWRRAPWQLKAYALFALGITAFELTMLLWTASREAEVPYLRYVASQGYLLTLPLVYFGVRERRPRFLIGIFVILAIHVLFVFARPALGLDLDAVAIVLTVVVALAWMAILGTPAVRRFFSSGSAPLEG